MFPGISLYDMTEPGGYCGTSSRCPIWIHVVHWGMYGTDFHQHILYIETGMTSRIIQGIVICVFFWALIIG